MIIINIKLKLKQIWTDYQLIIKIALASFVISIILVTICKFFFYPKIKLEQFSNNLYTVQYDSTWDLTKKESNYASLRNKDATINIEITALTNDYLYMSLENIVEEISYSVLKNNPNYYLIGKQEILVTANQYEGYQLLYENDDREVLLTLFKHENKIISIVYEAPYEDFDILLDSVKEIIHNFKLSATEYEISFEQLEIQSETLSLSENEDIEVEGTKKYQIADKHYLVEFEVPEKFVSKTFNSRYLALNYEGLSIGNVSLTAAVYEDNLYEVLTELKNHTFDYSIKSAISNGSLKEESFTKINEEQYIYHVIYDYNNNDYDEVYLIYELDYRRVFAIKVTAFNCTLSNDIIDNISITNKTKYADYIYRTIKNDRLVNELKYAYSDYQDNKRKYNQVILYTPINYRELDDEVSNIYETRIFNKDFNEVSREYDFEVRYSINSLSIGSNLNSLESVYYNSKNRKKLGIKTYNGKKFEVYTYNSNNNYVYVLFYKLECGDYLQIAIESNGKKITNNTIIELTKFDENIYVMN